MMEEVNGYVPTKIFSPMQLAEMLDDVSIFMDSGLIEEMDLNPSQEAVIREIVHTLMTLAVQTMFIGFTSAQIEALLLQERPMSDEEYLEKISHPAAKAFEQSLTYYEDYKAMKKDATMSPEEMDRLLAGLLKAETGE